MVPASMVAARASSGQPRRAPWSMERTTSERSETGKVERSRERQQGSGGS